MDKLPVVMLLMPKQYLRLEHGGNPTYKLKAFFRGAEVDPSSLELVLTLEDGYERVRTQPQPNLDLLGVTIRVPLQEEEKENGETSDQAETDLFTNREPTPTGKIP